MSAFQGQIAVVTGAGSGIGKAVALSLAKQGATVCLLDRHIEALENVITCKSGETPLQLLPYRIDLTQADEISRFVTHLQSDFRQVDILIHSAGIYARGSLATAPVAEFESQYRTNVLAPFTLTQALLSMLSSYRGQIVFINSSAGLAATENLSQYAATKHALKAVADSLRQEVNKNGLRVLSIYLGRTATPLQEQVHAMENKTYRPENLMQADDVAQMIIAALNIPRTAEVTEIQMRPFKR